MHVRCHLLVSGNENGLALAAVKSRDVAILALQNLHGDHNRFADERD
jgi:hypothetical protein